MTKHLSEVLVVGVLLLIFSVFAYWQWGIHYSESFIDFGRELYVIRQVSNGQALYADQYSIYPPLSYQINAGLFILFGDTTTTAYVAAAVNSALFLLLIYSISRFFLNKAASFLFGLLIIVGFQFYHNYYQTPYSFGIVYGSTMLYVSVLSILFFLRNHRPRYLYIAWLFSGLSMAFKYEYLLYMPILFWTMFSVKELRFRDYLVGFMAYAIAPLISLILLLMSGTKLIDIYETFIFIRKFMSGSTLMQFYHSFSSMNPNIVSVTRTFYSLGLSLVLFLVTTAMVGLKNRLVSPNTKGINVALYFYALLASCILYISIIVYSILFSSHTLLAWIPLSLIVFLIMYKSDVSFRILAVSALLICLKGLFFLPMLPYGVFLLPLAVLVFFIHIYRKHNSIFTPLIVTYSVILFLSSILSLNMFTQEFLSTPSGVIRVPVQYLSTFQEYLDYSKVHIAKNDSVLVLPEGQIFNYISGNPSHDKLHTMFLPPNVEAYGEENLITSLSKDRMAYIVFIKRSMSEYFPLEKNNRRYFGEAYGQRIHSWIMSNYDEVKQIGPNGYMTIYRRK